MLLVVQATKEDSLVQSCTILASELFTAEVEMYTLFGACLFGACVTTSNSHEMNPVDRSSPLFYLSFHARVVLVQQLHENMQRKSVSSDDADIEPWIHISGRISECAELIKVEELTKSHKDEELRALVESTISEVSNFFDASLLLYLQNKDDLFKSLNHYLPYRGQTWYEFVEDKTPYYQDNGKPAELGLKYLEAFKTVAGRFQDEINRALNYQPPSMKTTRMTRVFYVTDRRKIRGVLNRYTLLYGFEDVSIPVKHTRGKVETPNILRGANDKFHVRIKGGKTIGRKPIFLTAIKKVC